MLAVHAAARDRVCCRRRRSRAVATIHVRPAKEKRGMSSQRLLIRNGFVVSMDPDVGDVPYGDVLVEDGKIAEIRRGLEASEAEQIDATGMIVMPGFVDTHRHTWQTPVRGVLPCCTLDHYFAVMLGSVGGHYRPEDVHTGNYAGALEALNGGVTTLLDWSHINNTPDHSDAAIQGLKDAGIRAIYAHGVPTGGEWWAFSELEHPEDIRRIRDTYFSSDDGLITLALAARAPGNSNFEVAKHDWELARDLAIRISVHVGMRLTSIHVNHVKNMHDLGLLGDDTTYIHCTDSTDEELVLLKVNAINTAPMVDTVGTIVVFADTSNVDSVFVAGRAVKRSGELVDVDLDDIFRRLDESRNHILSRGELLPEWASEPVAAV